MIFGSVQKILEKLAEYLQAVRGVKSINFISRVSEFTEKILENLHLIGASLGYTDIFYGVKDVESDANRCGALGRN